MPIKIPNALPATDTLRSENIFVMTETRAMTQDIRPLQLLLLNLMPTKIDTETQLARVLGNTPLQIELELIAPSSHVSKNTSQEHMLSFYKSFDQVKHRSFDGLIITGAPVELMEFEEVDYWPELCEIMEWSKTHAHSTLHICWGAQAGLYYHYGIQKKLLDKKLSGVYQHTVEDPNFILFRGFDDNFWVPHSRNTTVDRADIEAVPGLKVLSVSPEAGVYAVKSEGCKQVFLMGHAEYDPGTLNKEYIRDVKAGIDILPPENYFPNDDPTQPPMVRWRSCAHLLYANWLNYCVYQTTPYDISEIKSGTRTE
ncbi:MAG: homoserine O-succinyltransferase [Clostridia bacterium]|nr:homoserine O-succinyltransferase [Clostridia bacterium]